ncbi:MAG: energy transducer TonB [Syntrophorhabdaceae bacterium]|nr:energy transducer TonB [Syntrophorhabdaceae bacterium]
MNLSVKDNNIKEIISALTVSFLIHFVVLYLLTFLNTGNRNVYPESIEVVISKDGTGYSEANKIDKEGKIKKKKEMGRGANNVAGDKVLFREKIDPNPINTKNNIEETIEQRKISSIDQKNTEHQDVIAGSYPREGQILGYGKAETSLHNEGAKGINIPSTGKGVAGGIGSSLNSYPQSSVSSRDNQLSGGGGGRGGGTMDIKRDYGFIREAVLKGLVYPERAREMGIEGTVILSFTLTREAKIKDIKVLKSSGSALLDRAAKEALIKANLTNTPIHDIAIQLPVSFRLKEN